MAGFFIILFLVLQQIEGNFIYPNLVGKASGLSPVWVLAAVTIGGSIFGIVGIIIFVPLFSVIHQLLTEFSDRKLKEKKIDKF
jgi:predicted PurR-regulated permease PerM